MNLKTLIILANIVCLSIFSKSLANDASRTPLFEIGENTLLKFQCADKVKILKDDSIPNCHWLLTKYIPIEELFSINDFTSHKDASFDEMQMEIKNNKSFLDFFNKNELFGSNTRLSLIKKLFNSSSKKEFDAIKSEIAASFKDACLIDTKIIDAKIKIDGSQIAADLTDLMGNKECNIRLLINTKKELTAEYKGKKCKLKTETHQAQFVYEHPKCKSLIVF